MQKYSMQVCIFQIKIEIQIHLLIDVTHHGEECLLCLEKQPRV